MTCRGFESVSGASLQNAASVAPSCCSGSTLGHVQSCDLMHGDALLRHPRGLLLLECQPAEARSPELRRRESRYLAAAQQTRHTARRERFLALLPPLPDGYLRPDRPSYRSRRLVPCAAAQARGGVLGGVDRVRLLRAHHGGDQLFHLWGSTGCSAGLAGCGLRTASPPGGTPGPRPATTTTWTRSSAASAASRAARPLPAIPSGSCATATRGIHRCSRRSQPRSTASGCLPTSFVTTSGVAASSTP